MRITRQCFVLMMALASVAMVGMAASKAQPEFDRMKSLAGDWQGKASDGRMVHVSYQVVSAGSAVMESIKEPSESQMITMYYLDGDSLMMTHFCSANNQPRMRAEASGGPTDHIEFTFVDVTNLSSPEAGHMHAHAITWKDSSHIRQQWTWIEGGKERVETFELQRRP